MSWQDRGFETDRGARGGFGDTLRRIFGDGENPLSWGIPLYTAFGIRVRMHVLFIVVIVAQLVREGLTTRSGDAVLVMAAVLGVMFFLVLLHEYGHCFACRRVEGEADDILLWPLGGLASCRPPHTWRANLVTVLGGPGVNLVLYPFTAAALAIATGGLDAILVNPWLPTGALAVAVLPDQTQPWWLIGLAILHHVNTALFVFNMTIPMYPMDCGRVVRDLLWRAKGYRAATEIAVTVGMVTAGVLFVIAAVAGQFLLIGIAAFGGVSCYLERKQLRALEDVAPLIPDPMLDDEPEPGPTRAERAAERRAEKEAAERVAQEAEIDRILAKISTDGIGSLTKAERKILERASAESGR
ncbi:MAG: site-2 protease family protein [Planctomycetota bacterium]